MSKSKIKAFTTGIPLSTEYPISIVKEAIIKHVVRLKAAAVNLSNEYIGLKLEKDVIMQFFNDYNATDLVAFFGIDPEMGHATIFLTGLDANGAVQKIGNVYHICERWDGKFITANTVNGNASSLNTVFP